MESPSRLGKPVQFLHRLEDTVLVLLVVLIVLLSCAPVILRNLGINGFSWVDPAVRILVLWLAMFGALRTSRDQSHIAIDLISKLAPPALHRLAHTVTALAATVISGLAAWYCGVFVLSEYRDGLTAFLAVPAWICEAVIPFCLALISLRFGLHALQAPPVAHAAA